ncbi:MAG: alkaline phosphatase family protein [Brasilonema angustatum HA4187-MV1]|nr:alkaline phosphatase family protein [Brasilonema angustatum HA4187-MV1]
MADNTLDGISTAGSGSQGRNVIIYVTDGLRPSSVNPEDAPTLYELSQKGVKFVNSHSLFPTFTTPNASAIATGHYLGDTGDFSNTIYTGYPVFAGGLTGTPTPFIENDAILSDIDEHFGGNYLDEETLLAYAREHGYNTAAVGKLGPTLIQDVTQGNVGADGKIPTPKTIIIDDSTGKTGGVPLSPEITKLLVNAGVGATTPDRTNGVASTDQLSNGFSGNNTTPGTLAANTVQQQYFTNAITKAILPYFNEQENDQSKPFALVYWSRDPDGTQHNQGDSLNSLTPGINGPTSKAGVKNADNNLKEILNYINSDPQLAANTDIFITADHGFSTISKQFTDAQGGKVSDYASSLTYPGVNPGYLPSGFVAIDIAHELALPLYDADTATADGKNYALVDPTQGQRPRNGDGLIGGSGVIQDKPDAKVVVAANGGSDLIYIPDHNPETVNKVVDFLSKQDYTSGLFVSDEYGSVPGALPLSSINLKGSTELPTPDIVLNFRTFATDSNNPSGSQVEIADTALQQGQGMHGSFGRGDTYNNMIAFGPDFKQGYVDNAPVSNADVATTLANVLGFDIPSNGDLTGRVITEALLGGPDSIPYTTGILKSAPTADGISTYLNYQQVGDTSYFDAAGFGDRTVGLTTFPESVTSVI